MWPTSHRPISWVFRALGILLYVPVWITPSLAQEATIDEEVIRQWKAYEEFARSLQGTEWTTTSKDSGKVERLKVIRKQNRQCVLNCVIQDDKPFEQWRIANPWYAASIKRSKSNPSEVSLNQFSSDPQADLPGSTASSFAAAPPRFSPHFYVGLTSLSQFVADPHFKIKKVIKLMERDRPLVQVDYTHIRNNPKTGSSTTSQVRLVLDPARCWCIIRRKGTSTITMRGVRYVDSESETEYETVDHPPGFPLVKSSTTRTKLHVYRDKKAPKKSHTRKSEYEWEVNDNVPNEEFMLSAFGLPEPMGVEPPAKSHVWLWLLAATLAAAALAMLFAWLKRRQATASQVKN